jgi:hypothetical protein
LAITICAIDKEIEALDASIETAASDAELNKIGAEILRLENVRGILKQKQHLDKILAKSKVIKKHNKV